MLTTFTRIETKLLSETRFQVKPVNDERQSWNESVQQSLGAWHNITVILRNNQKEKEIVSHQISATKRLGKAISQYRDLHTRRRRKCEGDVLQQANKNKKRVPFVNWNQNTEYYDVTLL